MKTKLPLFIFSILLLLSSALFAQVGIGTNKPAASAALEVTSDSNAKGLLIPRLTDIQRAAINAPAEGLLIYQTSAPSGFYFFTNGEWKLIISQTNGKDLSSNDYTTLEKTKLAAITGTNTGDQTNISGNAGTATKLAAPKNINGVAFDGSADITIATSSAASAEDLTGTTLKSTVTGSSLTSVGTLGNLTVTNPIVGSVTGNAATATTATSAGTATTATKLAAVRKINNVDFDGSSDITIAAAASAEDLTGTTLKSTVTGSSLTSVGTLANLTVTNPIAGSVTGNAATVTTNANLTGVVTSVGNATSIANNAITNLMLANSAVANLSGTNTGDQDLSLLAPLLSPTLSGSPKAPTAASGTNDTQLATTAFVYDATTGKFVDITTNQTIAGSKTFSADVLVNGITVGKGNGAIGTNTAFGLNALNINTTGSNNTANGNNSLQLNTTGYSNTATGHASLVSNSTGSENTANGVASLASNSTGSQNTANGVNALYYNTIGNNNTANGLAALEGNTSGSDNTANGSRSLFSNRTGSDNTAIGSNSLKLNTSGYGNTANGVSSLQSNVIGNENTATGSNSLKLNTSGSSNTANGGNSLYSNTTGVANTANGSNSLYSNTTGYGNTATGYNALSVNTDGFDNTAIGKEANVGSGNLNNATAIGNGATVNASHTIQLGNTSVTDVKTSGTLTAGVVTYPNAHGTTGQVLTTNGTGSLTWSSPASASAAAAGDLSGTTLKSTVTGSSLTSVGTLTNLTVTNAISGSVTGNAGTATKLAATKTINGVAFDGSANITIPTSSNYVQVLLTNLDDETPVTIGDISIRIRRFGAGPQLEISSANNVSAFGMNVIATGYSTSDPLVQYGIWTRMLNNNLESNSLIGTYYFRLEADLMGVPSSSNVSYKLTVLTNGHGQAILRLTYYN